MEGPTYVTEAWLESRGACYYGIKQFLNVFGHDPVEVTYDNLVMAASADLPLGWLAKNILHHMDTWTECHHALVRCHDEYRAAHGRLRLTDLELQWLLRERWDVQRATIVMKALRSDRELLRQRLERQGPEV